MDQIQPYLDKALKLNDTLLGLPALPLVFLACIVFGYVLKAIPFYSNRYIPLGVFAFGVLAYLLITPIQSKVDFGRAIMLGMIAAGAGWFAHRRWVSKWIDDKLFESGDTQTFTDRPEPP